VDAIRDDGGTALGVTGDVTRFDEIEALRGGIEEGLGAADILVANAGGSFTPPAPLEDIPEAGWRATIDGNLTATFLTLKSFLPGLKSRGRGSIITIASSAGRKPDARAPIAYGAAKAAIVVLTQDVAAPSRSFRGSRELHRPGDDPDRAESAANPRRTTGGVGAVPPSAAARHASGRCRSHRVSRVAGCGLGYGRGAGRGRRGSARVSVTRSGQDLPRHVG
jgi:hypothetical protein